MVIAAKEYGDLDRHTKTHHPVSSLLTAYKNDQTIDTLIENHCDRDLCRSGSTSLPLERSTMAEHKHRMLNRRQVLTGAATLGGFAAMLSFVSVKGPGRRHSELRHRLG